MAYSTDILLNMFAIRSFRDTADRDYVHARLAYQSKLVPQFQWSALHCLEKYAKGILLLNRFPAKEIGHEVTGALNLLRKYSKFEVKLSRAVLRFIDRLESGAEFRYFEVSYYNEPFDIARLDCAVSELRRYCQALDWEVKTDGGSTNLLGSMLAQIEHAAQHNQRDSCIQNGWLEMILKDRKHPARKALVWQNLYFGASKRNRVKLEGFFEAGNSPLYLHPEILDEALKYVHLPKRVAIEWRKELEDRLKARD